MQDYIEIAEKNGVVLKNTGACQCCGATMTKGIHECVEIFSLGFDWIDYGLPENHIYRFLSVDAHTLQHPEIHGRWNNHFHLTRLHLIFTHSIEWNYQLSPQLSHVLAPYKEEYPDEKLSPPPLLNRGKITTHTIKNQSTTTESCQVLIETWAKEVYQTWSAYHDTVELIAQRFLKSIY